MRTGGFRDSSPHSPASTSFWKVPSLGWPFVHTRTIICEREAMGGQWEEPGPVHLPKSRPTQRRQRTDTWVTWEGGGKQKILRSHRGCITEAKTGVPFPEHEAHMDREVQGEGQTLSKQTPPQ